MSYTKGRHKGMRFVLAVLIAGIVIAALYAAGAPVAQASEHSPETAATDVPGAPPQQDAAEDEDRDPEANLPYLFAVFIITWAVFFGYIFVTSRRQKDMSREIEALRETLAEKERRVVEGEPSPRPRES